MIKRGFENLQRFLKGLILENTLNAKLLRTDSTGEIKPSYITVELISEVPADNSETPDLIFCKENQNLYFWNSTIYKAVSIANPGTNPNSGISPYYSNVVYQYNSYVSESGNIYRFTEINGVNQINRLTIAPGQVPIYYLNSVDPDEIPNGTLLVIELNINGFYYFVDYLYGDTNLQIIDKIFLRTFTGFTTTKNGNYIEFTATTNGEKTPFTADFGSFTLIQAGNSGTSGIPPIINDEVNTDFWELVTTSLLAHSHSNKPKLDLINQQTLDNIAFSVAHANNLEIHSAQQKANWTETNSALKSFIDNKPYRRYLERSGSVAITFAKDIFFEKLIVQDHITEASIKIGTTLGGTELMPVISLADGLKASFNKLFKVETTIYLTIVGAIDFDLWSYKINDTLQPNVLMTIEDANELNISIACQNNVIIDFGDGTTQNISTGINTINHTYPALDNYNIQIFGNLDTLNCNGSIVTILDISNCSNLLNFNCSENLLTTIQLNKILTDLDTFGLENGSLDITSNLELATDASSINSLLAKNWTVSYDSNIQEVTIGTQTWLLKNLDIDDSLGGIVAYDNNEANVPKYGRLYTLAAAQRIAASIPGFHLPTKEEFETLIAYLGGSLIAGGKLKEVGTTHWNSPNTGATNETGFTAVGAGSVNSTPEFVYINLQSYFWTSTPFDVTNTYFFYLLYYTESFGNSALPNNLKCSVRLIKD